MTTLYRQRSAPADDLFPDDDAAYQYAVARFCRAWDILERESEGSAWYAKVWAARADLDIDDATLHRAWEHAQDAGGEKNALCALWRQLDDAGQALLAAQQRPLVFSGAPLDYWREEVRLGCAASLKRLRAICAERGADYDATIEELRK